jgi:hypothetical protein
VRVRGPYDSDDNPYDDPSEGPRPPAGPRAFRVPTWVIVAKFGLAAAFVLAGLLAGDRTPRVVGFIAAAGVVIYAVRDIVARDRLVVDHDGITTVRGYAGRRRLTWAEIERMQIDERLRFGIRAQLLEVDAGEEIYLLSRYDLGAEPREAYDLVTALRG